MKPYDQDGPLSVIVLGTMISPGVVRLEGHGDAKTWEVRKPAGNAGAVTVLRGDDPKEFQAIFQLAGDDLAETDDEFSRWDSFQALIESTTNGPEPRALPVYHPDLARIRITEVVNGGIGGFIHDGQGGVTVRVTFRKYLPPKPKPAAKATGTDPLAAKKAERDALLAEALQP